MPATAITTADLTLRHLATRRHTAQKSLSVIRRKTHTRRVPAIKRMAHNTRQAEAVRAISRQVMPEVTEAAMEAVMEAAMGVVLEAAMGAVMEAAMGAVMEEAAPWGVVVVAILRAQAKGPTVVGVTLAAGLHTHKVEATSKAAATRTVENTQQEVHMHVKKQFFLNLIFKANDLIYGGYSNDWRSKNVERCH